jgi:RNA polymerase sigma-70 factor (ECF subfamily)
MPRDLVVRAQAGDHDAFAALAAASIGHLSDVARLILRGGDGAEDAVQEALVRAWLDIRGLRDPDRFDAWLYRLLVRACYRSATRDRGRRVAEIPMRTEEGGPAPDGFAAIAARDELERGFRRLRPDERAVLVLHHYLSLSDSEAADVLGVPLGTMKSRLNRATSSLRAALAADERRAVQVRESIA